MPVPWLRRQGKGKAGLGVTAERVAALDRTHLARAGGGRYRRAMHATRGLYAIVDPAACRGRDPVRVAGAILRGGCAALQLRAKDGSDRALLALARDLAAECRRAGVPFVVNDRPDLALLVGAGGLHLGQDDLPVAEARRIVGGAVAIGRSTHDEAQARSAVGEGADVVAFGPVFETASKANPDPVVGLERLERVCRESGLPVVAIGGITFANIEAVARAGARWAAAIGAVCGAEDPESAARALHGAFSIGGPR
jgi:thiamine-phosphate diphosphorylase